MDFPKLYIVRYKHHLQGYLPNYKMKYGQGLFRFWGKYRAAVFHVKQKYGEKTIICKDTAVSRRYRYVRFISTLFSNQ